MRTIKESFEEHIFANNIDRTPQRELMFKAGYVAAQKQMEERLKEAEALVKQISNYTFEDLNDKACTFFDMGDCGYSSKGTSHHDDDCLAKCATEYFKKWGVE